MYNYTVNVRPTGRVSGLEYHFAAKRHQKSCRYRVYQLWEALKLIYYCLNQIFKQSHNWFSSAKESKKYENAANDEIKPTLVLHRNDTSVLKLNELHITQH